MPLAIGALLALFVGLFATRAGLDRDRAFYPVVTIVVASYYVLFAVMGDSTDALIRESLIGVVFAAAATVGFRRSLWLVALALTAHGVFDFFHGALVSNPGVPDWWPAFCGGYDVAAGGFLAALLKTGRIGATP